jgi:hypothetical protein
VADTAVNSYYYTFLVQQANAAGSYSSQQMGETVFMRVAQPPYVPVSFYPLNGRVYLNLGSRAASGHRQFDWTTIGREANGALTASTGGGAFTGACPNGVRFFFSGSTITGTIRCYGMKKGGGA